MRRWASPQTGLGPVEAILRIPHRILPRSPCASFRRRLRTEHEPPWSVGIVRLGSGDLPACSWMVIQRDLPLQRVTVSFRSAFFFQSSFSFFFEDQVVAARMPEALPTFMAPPEADRTCCAVLPTISCQTTDIQLLGWPWLSAGFTDRP